MKHVVNWTIGSFFRTIGRIIAYLIVGAIIAFAFSYKSKAATLTSYDTYQRYWNEESGCGTSNKYSYTTYANNNSGNDLWQQATIGTRVNSKAAQIGFNFQYNLTAGKYYDVVVNFASSDLSNALNSTNVYVDSGTSCQDFNKSFVSLVGFSLSNSGTNYSNKATLRITANTATTYWGFYFYKGVGQFVAGPNNFSVSSITINEVQASDTDIIINNNTNNTNNIINNQNETTQQIIDNQNELLGNKCSNIYQSRLPSTTACGISVTPNDDGSYTINGTSTCSIDFRLDQNYRNGATNLFNLPKGTYTLSSGNLPSGLGLNVMQQNTWVTYFYNDSSTSTNTNTLNSDVNDLFIYIYVDNNTTINNYTIKPMFTLGTNSKTYCKYGSYSSKLDDTTNAINDVNDSLNNDNVDGATSKAGNFFSNFTTNTHGLTSIITAPLSAIQSLTNATCRPLVLPLPFVNQNLTLPCMRSIYVDNFGGFMTLYDTITLGIVSYWVLVRIFTLVKDFKNPDHDEVEVMDL